MQIDTIRLIKEGSLVPGNNILLLIGNALGLSLALTLSHALMKSASTRFGDSILESVMKTWHLVGAALSIYMLIFFYYLYILKHLNLNQLYPIYTGLSICAVFTVGVVYFNETASPAQIAGCALIAVGVLLVSA